MPNILHYILLHTPNIYNPYGDRAVGFDNHGYYFIDYNRTCGLYTLLYQIPDSNESVLLFYHKDLKNVEKYFVKYINSKGGCYLNSLDVYNYENYMNSKDR